MRFALAVALCAGLVTCCSAVEDTDLPQTVVKVFAAKRTLNLSSPWRRGDVKSATGSGVWLGGRRILTNNHVILYASRVSVQTSGAAERHNAKVIAHSPEMDLAILEIESEDLFAGLQPPAFLDALPEPRAPVQVYGYPTGGTSQSVTEGIVSRIEYQNYNYGTHGLRIQVDAALNPGNSGGPAFMEGKIAGIVFSRLRQGDNIGYLIPGEEVQLFLQDIEDGQYDGKPRLLDRFQNLQNEALRQKFALDAKTTGVLVKKPFSPDPEYPLQVGDIVTHVGNHPVDNVGRVKLENGLRVSLQYLIPRLAADGQVGLTIVRRAEPLQVAVPVQRPHPRLIPPLKGRYPVYFVYGPLVLVEATSEFIGSLETMAGTQNTRQRAAAIGLLRAMSQRKSPLLARRFDPPAFDGERLVMIAAKLLPHPIGSGYRNPQTQIVVSVNGTPIRNLAHAVETLRDLKDSLITFEFADQGAETLVFDRQKVLDSMEDIRIDSGIVRQGSPKLLEIWDGTTAP